MCGSTITCRGLRSVYGGLYGSRRGRVGQPGHPVGRKVEDVQQHAKLLRTSVGGRQPARLRILVGDLTLLRKGGFRCPTTPDQHSMMASLKTNLPQEGTTSSAGGESLPEATLASGCPSYSGGGKNCFDCTTTLALNTVTDARDVEVTGSGMDEEMELDTELMLSEDSTSMSENSRRASPMPRKRRGRPPTTGHYVGLAKAKLALIEAEREEERRRAEAEVVAASRAARTRAQAHRMPESVSEDEEFQAAGSLSQMIQENVEVIRKVATTSKNLKGGYVRALKDAAEEISKMARALQGRCSTEETKGLQADNARLRAEVAQLRQEVTEMKAHLLTPNVRTEDAEVNRQPEPQRQRQSDNEELVRTILCQVGTMINARFEALQDRLLPEKRLRPPLAADSRPELVDHSAPEAPKVSGKATGKTSGKAPKKAPGKPAQERTTEPQAPPQPRVAVEPEDQQPKEMPWSTVVKKGLKKKKDRPRVFTNTDRGKAPRAPPDSPPKTAAVVVTITPEAIAKGLTYDAVIAEAKAKIKLQDVGITTGVRFRVCATGARRFEVLGTENGPQADALAERLTQIFDGDSVRITRPAKTIEIKISGLDDSSTIDEVLASVSEAGGCAKDSLKSSGVVRDRYGVGHAWVECAVPTAKRVAAAGRLTISWVTANVTLLEPRPLRCYRCLQKGHVRAQCNAEVDRSKLCFRCGVEGHKFKGCLAKPHCTICAAAQKPAEHKLGGRGCTAPAPKITRGKKTLPQPAQQQVSVEVAMETDEGGNRNGSTSTASQS
ncbi:PREDICTED: uncharacterized protein LOC106121001 [Papilio xuthus]|uniref:Uncharacterized protein LOC106121001 n=1 Tax=Papilio xuthus TaxID=66420 RepID=A0AAJ6ZG12_PAPXU|nr:PREDICTED: uncharacterized protein LOC106121001 [Papilio xuthus]